MQIFQHLSVALRWPWEDGFGRKETPDLGVTELYYLLSNAHSRRDDFSPPNLSVRRVSLTVFIESSLTQMHFYFYFFF